MKRNCVLMVSLLCCLFLSSRGGQDDHLKLPDEETIKATQETSGVAKLTSASLTKDENGDPAILVEYTWTNTTDHPLIPIFNISLNATQVDEEDDRGYKWLLGKRLVPSYDDEVDESAPPGTTINGKQIFTLYDETGVVTVRLYGTPFDDWITDPDVIPEDGLVDIADYDPASLPNSQ